MRASFFKLRSQVLLHTLAAAALMGLVSLLVHGFDAKLLLGLVAGTATTVVNYGILERSVMNLMAKNSRGPVVAGYFLRLPIYGVVFYLCIRAGIPGAIGCALGFVSLHLALMYLYGIRTLFPGAPKNPLNDWTEPKQWADPSEWDDEDDGWGPLPKWPQDKK